LTHGGGFLCWLVLTSTIKLSNKNLYRLTPASVPCRTPLPTLTPEPGNAGIAYQKVMNCSPGQINK
ncbi:hypothetical protein, partial [Noviherbaspirillum aerium]|uniref:hypothetical protein n=1 Tax=Noviherbaspirillum aerium TaxID=2588497 RepID=UPI001CEFA03C